MHSAAQPSKVENQPKKGTRRMLKEATKHSENRSRMRKHGKRSRRRSRY